MAGLAPEGSEFDANLYDANLYDSNFNEIQSEGQDLFTSFDEVYESFDSTGFEHPICFKKPYAIQKRGFVPFCKGLDVILQTPYGTGKTITFCVGISQRLVLWEDRCQALVIVPTMKLADQIRKNISKCLGSYFGGKFYACGKACQDQANLSRRNKTELVVVGTPGQVYDLLQSRSLSRNHIKMVVLDEADEMLSRGFEDQIYGIFQHLASEVQIGVCSATMPPEVFEITRKFMKKPLRIFVKCDPPRNPSLPDMSAKGRTLSPAPLEELFLNKLDASLINQIILRLPLSSVLGFFSISKPWLSPTTSQYFLRRLGPQLAPLCDHPPPLAFLIQDCYTPTRRNFLLCSGEPEVNISRFDLDDFLPISFPRDAPYVVIGSCGDLMLCSTEKICQSKYFVVNPITHHWVAVTPPSHTYKNVLVGFICEPASIAEAKKGGELRFSVVRIPFSQDSTTKVKVSIFMSKDRQWKDYIMTLTEDLSSCIRIAIACKGSLYWQFVNYGVKVMALDPFNPEKGIHVIQNVPDKICLKKKDHVLGFCQAKLRMSEMFWSETNNRESLSINIWELKESKAKWQLVHEVQLKEILDANPLIVHPRNVVGSWCTLGFHPCSTEIIYFYLECNEIKNVICCNWKEKRLKIESENDIYKAIGSRAQAFHCLIPPTVDAIPFLLPRVPTPLPAFEAIPEDVPPWQQ